VTHRDAPFLTLPVTHRDAHNLNPGSLAEVSALITEQLLML